MGKRKAVYKIRKTNFHGNRHTHIKNKTLDSPNLNSASARKLIRNGGTNSKPRPSSVDDVNMIFNVHIMCEQLEKCLRQSNQYSRIL